jgi:hypothetical protein
VMRMVAARLARYAAHARDAAAPWSYSEAARAGGKPPLPAREPFAALPVSPRHAAPVRGGKRYDQ